MKTASSICARLRDLVDLAVRWHRWLGTAPLALAICLIATPASSKTTLTVMAAASTTDAMRSVAAAYERRHGVQVRLALGASSTLARQIEAGAAADLYLSANVQWMDYLEQRHLVVSETRRNLLANSLVLIAPQLGSGEPLADLHSLPTWLGERRLVIGDPAHVPAGIYARAAFQALGIWDALRPQVAYAASVRDALALVGRGEAAAGATYATDAQISDDVVVIAEVPRNLHPPVRYQAALIAGRDRPAARELLRFLHAQEAARIFESFGFTVLNAAPDGPE